jgi:hypothetical protein
MKNQKGKPMTNSDLADLPFHQLLDLETRLETELSRRWDQFRAEPEKFLDALVPMDTERIKRYLVSEAWQNANDLSEPLHQIALDELSRRGATLFQDEEQSPRNGAWEPIRKGEVT